LVVNWLTNITNCFYSHFPHHCVITWFIRRRSTTMADWRSKLRSAKDTEDKQDHLKTKHKKDECGSYKKISWRQRHLCILWNLRTLLSLPLPGDTWGHVQCTQPA